MAKEILELKNGFLIENKTEVEEGVILSGYFKKWRVVNGNGEKYDENSYDDFIENYYVKNKLNVTVNLMHGQGFTDLAGKVINMRKDEVGIFINVLISKGAVHYKKILLLLEDKVLQGFSDEGFATDFEFKNNEVGENYALIKKAILTKISLVDIPAEATAQFEFRNATRFEGFGRTDKDKDKKEKVKEGENPDFL